VVNHLVELTRGQIRVRADLMKLVLPVAEIFGMYFVSGHDVVSWVGSFLFDHDGIADGVKNSKG